MYFVYILKSLRIKRHYVGHTDNLRKRLKQHNAGMTKSTKAYIPWKIIYTEEFKTRTEAIQREKEIKSYKGGIKFKKLIDSERWQSPRMAR